MSDTPDYQRELAEWKAAAADLQQRLDAMKSAASSAAATTITAIERIQEMEKVVNAAVNWHQGGQHHKLTDAVRTWLNFRKSWS